MCREETGGFRLDLEFVKVFHALGDGFEDAVEDGDGEGTDAVSEIYGGSEIAEGVVLLFEGVFDNVDFLAEKLYIVVDLQALSI